jgi:hypothetical protein
VQYPTRVLDRHPKLHFSLPHGGGVLLMLMVRIDHGSTVRPEIEKLRLPQPPSKYLQRFTFTRFLIHKPFRFEVDGETIAHAFALNKSAAAKLVNTHAAIEIPCKAVARSQRGLLNGIPRWMRCTPFTRSAN